MYDKNMFFSLKKIETHNRKYSDHAFHFGRIFMSESIENETTYQVNRKLRITDIPPR